MKYWAVYDETVKSDRLFNDDVIGRRSAASFASTKNVRPELIEIKDKAFEDEDNIDYFIDTDDTSLVH